VTDHTLRKRVLQLFKNPEGFLNGHIFQPSWVLQEIFRPYKPENPLKNRQWLH
jgi:hypothetical protein